MLTQDELKQYLHYDPLTGVFCRVNNSRGKSGSINKSEYRVISVKNKPYYAHRLAWLYMTGEFPKGMLDHINQIKSDNVFTNLREADKALNSKNTPVRSHSQVGYKNIGFDKRDNTYCVKIIRNGKEYYFGRSKSLEDILKKREEAYAALGGW